MNLEALRQQARARAQRGTETVWSEYVAWLTATFPRVAAALAPPDPRVDGFIDSLQQALGVPMPAELLTLYRLTGGEPRRFDDDKVGNGVLFGSRLMTPAEVVEHASTPGNWREDGLDGDSEDPDAPVVLLEPARLRPGRRHRRWLRVLDDTGGNYTALDLAPGPMGTLGQLINVGRDQDHRFVVAESLTEFIAVLHELGATGHVHVNEASDENDSSALRFGPTTNGVIDQLRLWSFPGR